MGKRLVVKLFVSSPGDCKHERTAVAKAVEEFNNSARTLSNLEIQLIASEDLYPGIAKYPQQVINKQLPEYEIYVGLWRKRMGTVTPQARSGTVEELNEALSRYRRTRRPWIMCYFLAKSSDSFRAIQDTLKNNGCFYHTYENSESLQRMFLSHLLAYMKIGYRRPGESTTEASNDGAVALSSVIMSFQIEDSVIGARNQSLERVVVSIGRNPERNDIVLRNKKIHREQGLFVWKEGEVLFVDLVGDTLYMPRGTSVPEYVPLRQVTLGVGDAVVLPDGSRIILRAIFP